MKDRTFGWVQNPSDFQSLQHTVQIFDPESGHYARLRDQLVPSYIPNEGVRDSLQAKLNKGEAVFTYEELVGHSRDANNRPAKSRAVAVADALIQVSIPSQQAQTNNKYWTDNWTADGFLRWAVSLNFVQFDRDTDEYTISPLGAELAQVATEPARDEILKRAFLRYPPATQVLSILAGAAENGHPWKNKFEIGHKLGFLGEPGFTSYNSSLMLGFLQQANTSKEVTTIRADVEGTADKYARMIAMWLIKVGFVETRSPKIAHRILGPVVGFMEYRITGAGLHAIRQAQGSSKNNRVAKFVMWEFFATTGKSRGYVRTRRARIVQLLMATPTKSFDRLVEQLHAESLTDDPAIITNDLYGLNHMGIRVYFVSGGSQVQLRDTIQPFTIPIGQLTQSQGDKAREQLKAKFLAKTDLLPRYVELLDIAYDSKRNRDFEMVTAELFNFAYLLPAVHLGGVRKPDALVATKKFGIIVDTKAYANGYSRNANQADEMARYITENQKRDPKTNPNRWWDNFDASIPPNAYYFLWVSGFFTGQFADQLTYTAHRTNTHGGALNVEQLLIGANMVQTGQLDRNKLPEYMQDKEITFGTI